MYLDSIALVRTYPCLAEIGKIIVVGQPSRPLDEVLPYLATLPNVIAYNPELGTLTFRRQPGFLTFQTNQVYITQVKDIEEGLQLLSALTDAINATWANRDKLTALTSARRMSRPLDVWALLPQTNCKQCGEETCMAFAFALLQHQRTPAECPPLRNEPTFADRRTTLEAML